MRPARSPCPPLNVSTHDAIGGVIRQLASGAGQPPPCQAKLGSRAMGLCQGDINRCSPRASRSSRTLAGSLCHFVGRASQIHLGSGKTRGGDVLAGGDVSDRAPRWSSSLGVMNIFTWWPADLTLAPLKNAHPSRPQSDCLRNLRNGRKTGRWWQSEFALASAGQIIHLTSWPAFVRAAPPSYRAAASRARAAVLLGSFCGGNPSSWAWTSILIFSFCEATARAIVKPYASSQAAPRRCT